MVNVMHSGHSGSPQEYERIFKQITCRGISLILQSQKEKDHENMSHSTKAPL